MRSTAPALIYEEGDLDQALAARRLRHRHRPGAGRGRGRLPGGAASSCASWCRTRPRRSQLYKEPIPLFHRYQVESQFDAMHSPVVQLRSGGYIVINPTEALVAIDVNSGRSTKERNIEETALRTNIEAAEEVARQVRLRDLAGLIVIDFIDMEETRHQRQVEHKVKDAMRNDRARIQIGRISRLRPARDVAPAAAPQPARAFDRDLPALRRHRPHPLDRIGGAACAARDRGGRRAPPRQRDRGQRAAQRRALPAQPEAPHAVRDREALRLPRCRSRPTTSCTPPTARSSASASAATTAPAQELARATYDAGRGRGRPPRPKPRCAESAEGRARSRRTRRARHAPRGDRRRRAATARGRRSRRRGRARRPPRRRRPSGRGRGSSLPAAENGHDAPPATQAMEARRRVLRRRRRPRPACRGAAMAQRSRRPGRPSPPARPPRRTPPAGRENGEAASRPRSATARERARAERNWEPRADQPVSMELARRAV